MDVCRFLLAWGTRWILSHEDQLWAREAAAERVRRNKARGCYRPMIPDTGDPLLLEYWACCAEIAFARMIGIQPVLIKDRWAGQPNGYLPNGLPYAVVHRTRPEWDLLVPRRSNVQRDWLFMLLVSALGPGHPVYEWRGYMPGTVVLHYDNLWNPKGRHNPAGWCYKLRQKRLRQSLEYW
jgi:hypothetical protein